MRRISRLFKFDVDLWREFKAKIVLRGETMTAVLERKIREYLEEEKRDHKQFCKACDTRRARPPRILRRECEAGTWT